MNINTIVTNFLGNKSVISMLTRAQLTQTPPPVVAAGDGPHVFPLMCSWWYVWISPYEKWKPCKEKIKFDLLISMYDSEIFMNV